MQVFVMSPAGIYRILMLCACLSCAPAQPGRERSFTAIQDQDTNNVTVNQITADTLKSGLTTVFLPITYIIIFALGLPSNAMAIWVMVFRSKKIHPSSIYMGNLALADLMFVILTPLKIAYHLKGNNWTFGEGTNNGYAFYITVLCLASLNSCLDPFIYYYVSEDFREHVKNTLLCHIII